VFKSGGHGDVVCLSKNTFFAIDFLDKFLAVLVDFERILHPGVVTESIKRPAVLLVADHLVYEVTE
jgi:hypothetical protein